MRQKLIYAFSAIAIVLLVRNLYSMFMVLPDEADQGPIYRILFFHAPAFVAFAAAALAGLIASILFLVRRRFEYDTFAVAAVEVGLVFGAINLLTGMVWGRIIWGIWWTWDARLTSMLVSWLMYGGYLMLRHAIDEPTQRGRISAVFSIFAFPGLVITYKAIDWWRTQHPAAVLSFRSGGEQRMDPGMEATLLLNMVALILVAGALILVRMRQEAMQRELDGLRREAHAI